MGCALQDKTEIDKEKLIVGQQNDIYIIEIVQTRLSVTDSQLFGKLRGREKKKKKRKIYSFFPTWNAYFACYT